MPFNEFINLHYLRDGQPYDFADYIAYLSHYSNRSAGLPSLPNLPAQPEYFVKSHALIAKFDPDMHKRLASLNWIGAAYHASSGITNCTIDSISSISNDDRAICKRVLTDIADDSHLGDLKEKASEFLSRKQQIVTKIQDEPVAPINVGFTRLSEEDNTNKTILTN
ncbi:MAG: hypothetical protein LBS74_04450 [Oscillospiraceae bacterium]|jgi:hypothetical protein|nr:hypothetical protein [Oscillospiraceae bacterium]